VAIEAVAPDVVTLKSLKLRQVLLQGLSSQMMTYTWWSSIDLSHRDCYSTSRLGYSRRDLAAASRNMQTICY